MLRKRLLVQLLIENDLVMVMQRTSNRAFPVIIELILHKTQNKAGKNTYCRSPKRFPRHHYVPGLANRRLSWKSEKYEVLYVQIDIQNTYLGGLT